MSWSVLGNVKYTFNPAVCRALVFVNGGAGLFHFDPGDAQFGFNLGAGLHLPVSRRFAVEGNAPATTTRSRRALIGGSARSRGLVIFF